MEDIKDTSKRPELSEIATSNNGRDITKGYIEGLRHLSPSDKVLNQVGGYEVYEELLKDDQVSATFSQRRNAVISRPWSVTPGGQKRQDKQAAELIEQTLKQLDWDTVTDHMLYARLFGFAVAEVIWKIENSQVKICQIKVRDRRRFAFSIHNELLMLTTSKPDGESLPQRKFWTASVGASHADEPYGLGLGHALYWPVWFKRNGARFWATYLEKFGSPTAIGTFPMGASKEEQNKLLYAAQAVATDSGIILPEGIKLELLEASRGGNVSYENWMHYWDSAIAKVVLGQTMTTEDGSSYAQSTVHYDVRQDIVAADADLVCQSANNSWVKWLVDYNLPGAAYPQIWRDMEDAEDLEQRSNRDKTLFDMGHKLTPEAVAKIYGDDYESIEPSKTSEPGQQIAQKQKTDVQLAEEAEYLSPVEPMAEQLAKETEMPWQAVFEYILGLVDSAPDLPTLRDQLLASYSDLPTEELTNVMAMAFAAAELSGHFDVMRESNG